MTKLFGNKSQRDLKEITPYVEKVKAVYPSIKELSNDELRGRIDAIKQRIQDYVADERAKVNSLREGIDGKELEEREAIWAEVDKIEKEITDKMEVVLEEVLPEVFAIVKDTARRFAENPEVVVTANDFDAHLAGLRKIYTKKRALLLDLMEKHLAPYITWDPFNGGLFAWCHLPKGVDMMEFVQKALEKKVCVVPGTAFLTDENEPCDAFRINFSTPTDEQLTKGITLLGETIREMVEK